MKTAFDQQIFDQRRYVRIGWKHCYAETATAKIDFFLLVRVANKTPLARNRIELILKNIEKYSVIRSNWRTITIHFGSDYNLSTNKKQIDFAPFAAFICFCPFLSNWNRNIFSTETEQKKLSKKEDSAKTKNQCVESRRQNKIFRKSIDFPFVIFYLILLLSHFSDRHLLILFFFSFISDQFTFSLLFLLCYVIDLLSIDRDGIDRKELQQANIHTIDLILCRKKAKEAECKRAAMKRTRNSIFGFLFFVTLAFHFSNEIQSMHAIALRRTYLYASIMISLFVVYRNPHFIENSTNDIT